MLGHWQTIQTQIRRRIMRRLIRVCTVCLNYRELRLNETVLSRRSELFSQPTLRDNLPSSAVSALISQPNTHERFLYSRTTMARTPMARSPWLIRTRFESLRNSSDSSRKQIFKRIFLFYREIVCCMYSLESPHRGDSDKYTQHTITV